MNIAKKEGLENLTVTGQIETRKAKGKRPNYFNANELQSWDKTDDKEFKVAQRYKRHGDVKSHYRSRLEGTDT